MVLTTILSGNTGNTIYFSDTKHCSEGDIYAVVFPIQITNAPHHHYMKYKTASVLIELGPTNNRIKMHAPVRLVMPTKTTHPSLNYWTHKC